MTGSCLTAAPDKGRTKSQISLVKGDLNLGLVAIAHPVINLKQSSAPSPSDRHLNAKSFLPTDCVECNFSQAEKKISLAILFFFCLVTQEEQQQCQSLQHYFFPPCKNNTCQHLETTHRLLCTTFFLSHSASGDKLDGLNVSMPGD